MRTTAPPFVSAPIIGAPLSYAWNDDLEVGFFAEKDQNVRLYKAIDRIAFRAKYALGVAIANWIVWRFHNIADTTDLLQRLEAAQPSMINWRYTKDLIVELEDAPPFSSDRKIDGPLRLTLNFVGEIHRGYITGYIYTTEAIVRIAVLTRHVLPSQQRKDFDAWLKASISRAGSVYPPQAPYDTTTEQYIATTEEPVPIELYDLQWTYTPQNAQDALRALLQSLDPKTNPYLRTASEMTTAGFIGTPYQP